MLTLASRSVELRGIPADKKRLVLRLRERATDVIDPHDVFLARDGEIPTPGVSPIAVVRSPGRTSPVSADQVLVLPEELGYLADGDVIAVSVARPSIRVLYRRNSPHNSFLLTERCNHYCLMCSQPPKDIDDGWILDELLESIPLIDTATREIGFTGGEPTLLGERFLHLVREMRNHLPSTALHILSNGRRFADVDFARQYAGIGHADVMLGIPIYAATSQLHDYIVQADGAFDETIRGILTLKAVGQKVEIRVVIHRQNYAVLPALAEFIARNLTFVDHVALMGLEMTGFAKANIEELWIDPFDYQQELYAAASLLDDMGLRTSLYNHQLCVLDRRLWSLAARSISDWKNEYGPECVGCVVKDQCGGFFATGRVRRSQHISPVSIA